MRSALLIDFGGVLTNHVGVAHASFCEGHGLEPDAFAKAISAGGPAAPQARSFEAGQIEKDEFEAAVAAALGEHVPADGLVAALLEPLEIEPVMIEAVQGLRASGVRVVLVSNSFGTDSYDRWDLTEFTDAVIISGAAGVAKPSRGIYDLALEEAGVGPEAVVFVDDYVENIEAAEALGMEAILHVDHQTTVPELERAFGVELRGGVS